MSDHACAPETCTCFRRGLESVLMIRCVEHRAVPQRNQTDEGAECGACIVPMTVTPHAFVGPDNLCRKPIGYGFCLLSREDEVHAVPAQRNAEALIRECVKELREYGDRLHEEMELERAGAFHEAARIVTSYAGKLAAPAPKPSPRRKRR